MTTRGPSNRPKPAKSMNADYARATPTRDRTIKETDAARAAYDRFFKRHPHWRGA